MSLSMFSSIGSCVRSQAATFVVAPVKQSFYVGVALIGLSLLGASIATYRNKQNQKISRSYGAMAAAGTVLTVPYLVVKSRLFGK